ncbi:AraC family transcriptional regulator [Paenibacillus sp. N4]|uniref:AraC family transcriptional regulator n=1 Tax=Paenibacillus vietnamensis TaxID=2590547 RepID=UPI001CD136E8|nr:AraC family transcriptional regulator [Paenibacillus vietnamensis]MCA0753514.1 AraC family transcriptional regulator [Paenibacillus vietnamensis]
MDREALLAGYLSNVAIDLITVNVNKVAAGWRDIDYIPDYSKLYFICEGDGWLKIGDTEYHPKSGELILMPEGVKQSYSCINDNLYFKYWCHFSAKIGDMNLFNLLELNDYSVKADPAYIGDVFGSMVTHATSGTVYGKLLAKSKLMELFAYFFMNADLERISYHNLPYVEKLAHVISYIDANIERNMTIQELAGIAFLHPNYLIRLFKQQIGLPPIQYITVKKITKAKELLISTRGSVGEIAEQLGFSDLFYFSKQFKKNVGMNPTEFRKQMLTKE